MGCSVTVVGDLLPQQLLVVLRGHSLGKPRTVSLPRIPSVVNGKPDIAYTFYKRMIYQNTDFVVDSQNVISLLSYIYDPVLPPIVTRFQSISMNFAPDKCFLQRLIAHFKLIDAEKIAIASHVEDMKTGKESDLIVDLGIRPIEELDFKLSYKIKAHLLIFRVSDFPQPEEIKTLSLEQFVEKVRIWKRGEEE